MAARHAADGSHLPMVTGRIGELVAHGSVVTRRLLHGGRTWRVGYVEAVAVAAPARRQRHGAVVMGALADVIRGAHEFGALSATDDGAPLYRACGWQLWRGPVSALTPSGVMRTPREDGAIHVLPLEAALDLDGELACDWRDGDVW